MGIYKQAASRNRRGSRRNHCALMRQKKQTTTSSTTSSASSSTTTSSASSSPPTSSASSSPPTSSASSSPPTSSASSSPPTSSASPTTHTPQTPPHTTFNFNANTSSASKKKLDLNTNTDTQTTDAYIFINIKILKDLFLQCVCPKCSGYVTLSSKDTARRGLAHYLTLKCSSCSFSRDTFTSQTLPDRTYDINRRTVFSFLSCGLGFAGLNTFCEVMGMTGMTVITHTSHVASIHNKAESYKAVISEDAVARVRKHHGRPSGILDIAVSFDGSWQKRGHTSRHGIGAVIEVSTGLVIDCHVMATFCQLCASVGKRKREEGDAAYNEWYASHADSCTVNHEGSAGMMEVKAATVMWGRSLEKELRYTTVVSDGDSKTYTELKKLSLYDGVEIVKEECTNHVAKRLGTNLRKLVTTQSQAGNTLGGRKAGALTQVKIGLLQGHYKKAVASRCASVTELRMKIMRSYKHAASTDQNPQHEDCPAGKSSWCFYQRALAYGKVPPSHQGKSSCSLSPRVASAVLPVYKHLTTDALLSRCLGGLTQNANESFHSLVWMRCPKHLFVGRKRVEIALSLAAANFNSGSVGLHRFMPQIGCAVNGECIKRGRQRDVKRVAQAEQRHTREAKRRRIAISIATARAQGEYQRIEGCAYGAGEH